MTGPGHPTVPEGRKITVVADLELDVGGTPARLTSGADGRLVLSSPHPQRLWTAALASALPAAVGDLDGPRGLGRLARELAAVGVSVEVTGPQGTVAHLGAGVHSRLGQVVTGSSAVGPGAPSAVAAMLASRVPARSALAVLVTAVAAIAIARRHARAGSGAALLR